MFLKYVEYKIQGISVGIETREKCFRPKVLAEESDENWGLKEKLALQ